MYSGKYKNGIRYGILMGICVIVYMLVFYVYDQRMMLSHSVFWSTFFLYFMGMFLAAREERKEREFISFREALSISFVTYLAANVIFFGFIYILFNFVNPELPAIQKEISIEQFKDAGLAERFEEQIAAIEAAPNEFTLIQAVSRYAGSAIGGFILSLLVAGLTRNK